VKTRETGELVGIYIASAAGCPMIEVTSAEIIRGHGIKGDRYGDGRGSYQKMLGQRQITLISVEALSAGRFEAIESRRNLVTSGVELMWLIGREFLIGRVRFRGIKYCEPCDRPNVLAARALSFKDALFDRGGLIAECLADGQIYVGDCMPRPPR